jgi:DNA-binding XRE family transcriptional regulator
MAKKQPHVSDATIDDLIRDRDAREPGFKARVEARVEQLAVGRRVRSLREKRHLSQSELATRAGTGQASIARIESGKSVPKLDLLARIAAALGARLSVELR